jgi:hypothetical protein
VCSWLEWMRCGGKKRGGDGRARSLLRRRGMGCRGEGAGMGVMPRVGCWGGAQRGSWVAAVGQQGLRPVGAGDGGDDH